MARKLIIALLTGIFALALLSCTRVAEQTDLPGLKDNSAVEGQPVMVTFNLLAEEPPVATKALGEGTEDLHSLRLAVFGGSGYLKEYVEATPLGPPTDYTYQTRDSENSEWVPVTVKSYSFQVMLTLADSPRTVHFIGNGPETLPFGYDNAVMQAIRNNPGEMSYWQILHLPDGIKAKRNQEGSFINKDGEVIPEGGSGFIADDDTEDAFGDIPIIRNWAKIVLEAEDDSNFTPVSFALVNVPTRGSIAPYSASTGFIENYQELSFTDLENTSYPANLPYGTPFDTSVPDKISFESTPCGAGVAPTNGGALYLYERPIPSESVPPTYVIVYGYYENPDDMSHKGYYYYKVDLMDIWSEEIAGEIQWFSRYYPIYRNFKYKINIRTVLAAGHSSPEAAVNSVGSGDVSADITTSHLADISDGVGRLMIAPWMAKTFTEEHGEVNPAITELQARFSSGPGGAANMSPNAVKVELLPPEDEGEDIIYDLSIDSTPDEGGWRHITFKNHGPGRTVRSQTIRITGSHDHGRLYRDIVITVQPIQPMLVNCGQTKISGVKGSKESVTVSIPDGLVESMFPLDFIVEPERMTLTPDTEVANNNLPVTSGPSISENFPYCERTSFSYKRNVTWQEYKSLPKTQDSEGRFWRSFTCYFKSNCDESATVVWVYNPFFDKESDEFFIAHERRFANLRIATPVYEEQDRILPIEFDMTHDANDVYPDDYPEITIRVTGLNIPAEMLPANITKDENNDYHYTPSSADDKHIHIDFLTTTAIPEEISIELTAEYYFMATVAPVRFPMVKLLDGHPLNNNGGWASNSWSNVAWGYVNKDNGKNIVLGYKHHPDLPNPTVTLTMNSGMRDFTNANLKVITATPGPRSNNGDQDYHELEMRTITGTNDVDMLLTADGYVAEVIHTGRFNGNIRTMIASKAFARNNTYGFTMDNPTFAIAEDNGAVRVTFSRISAEPNGKVTFATDADITNRFYTVTFESQNANQPLLWIDMFFDVSGSTVMAPDQFITYVEEDGEMVPAGSDVIRYWGSNNQFIWTVPRRHLKAAITFTAPESRNVVMTTLYVKSFNGSLYEGGKVVVNL